MVVLCGEAKGLSSIVSLMPGNTGIIPYTWGFPRRDYISPAGCSLLSPFTFPIKRIFLFQSCYKRVQCLSGFVRFEKTLFIQRTFWLDHSCPPRVYLSTQLVLFLHVVLRFQSFGLVLYLNQGNPCARLACRPLPKSVYGIILPPPLQLFARAPPPPQRHLPQLSPSLHLKYYCEKCVLVVKRVTMNISRMLICIIIRKNALLLIINIIIIK